MHGIMTVMENIAYCIREEEGDRFSDEKEDPPPQYQQYARRQCCFSV